MKDMYVLCWLVLVSCQPASPLCMRVFVYFHHIFYARNACYGPRGSFLGLTIAPVV